MGSVRFTGEVFQRLLRKALGNRALTSSLLPKRPGFTVCDLSQLSLRSFPRELLHKEWLLFLHEPSVPAFRLFAKYGYQSSDLSGMEFAQGGPVIRHFSSHPIPIYAGQLRMVPSLKFLSQEERQALAKLDEEFFWPLCYEGRLVGLLVVGQEEPGLGNAQWIDTLEVEGGHVANVSEVPGLQHPLIEAGYLAPYLQQLPAPTDSLPHEEGSASGVAHDLNNVLTTIFSCAQLLEDEIDGNGVTAHAAAIRQAALDGAQLLRNIASSKDHDLTMRREIVDVNDLIISTLQLIDPHWRRGRISSSSVTANRVFRQPGPQEDTEYPFPCVPTVDLAVTLLPGGRVSGDLSELRRVLTNIVFNAVDAVSPGRGRIEITSGRCGRWAVIKVKDNGPGISPKVSSRIFEPHFSTKGHGSSGLGLSVSQRIVASHEGRLRVESTEGAGSTFTILLPLSQHVAAG